MREWLIQNIWSLLIGILLLFLFLAALRSAFRSRKKRKCFGCGQDCSACGLCEKITGKEEEK